MTAARIHLPIWVMDDVLKICNCGRAFTDAQSSGPTCYGCKAQSIGFHFRGPFGRGRAKFQSHTIREAIDEQLRDEKAANSSDMEFVGSRWV